MVLRQSEREVIATAGVDAAMYLKVLRCGEPWVGGLAAAGRCKSGCSMAGPGG